MYRLFSLFLIFIFFSTPVTSGEKPLWELGLGAGVLTQSYYTGTKQQRNFAFPVVLPIYRGDIFKSDDKGARAQLFKNSTYQLDISADFNPAIDSDEVNLRKGMPDIGNLLEIGPSLKITLNQDKNGSGWFAGSIEIRKQLR